MVNRLPGGDDPDSQRRYIPQDLINGTPDLEIIPEEKIIPEESQPSTLDLEAAKKSDALQELAKKYPHPGIQKEAKKIKEAAISGEHQSWNGFLNKLEKLIDTEEEIICKEIIQKLRQISSPTKYFKGRALYSKSDIEMYNVFLWWNTGDMSLSHPCLEPEPKPESKIDIVKKKIINYIRAKQGKSSNGLKPKENLEYLIKLEQRLNNSLKKLQELKKSKDPLDQIIDKLKFIRNTRKQIVELKEVLGIDQKKGDEQEQIQRLRDKYQI